MDPMGYSISKDTMFDHPLGTGDTFQTHMKHFGRRHMKHTQLGDSQEISGVLLTQIQRNMIRDEGSLTATECSNLFACVFLLESHRYYLWSNHFRCICVYIYIDMYIYIYVSNLSVYLSIDLSFYLSIHPFVHLSMSLSICISIYLCQYVSLCLYV